MDSVNKHRFLRNVNQQNQYSKRIHIPPVFNKKKRKKKKKEEKKQHHVESERESYLSMEKQQEKTETV